MDFSKTITQSAFMFCVVTATGWVCSVNMHHTVDVALATAAARIAGFTIGEVITAVRVYRSSR